MNSEVTFVAVVSMLFLIRFIRLEIRDAPEKPDCYGMSWCFGDCNTCKGKEPKRFMKLPEIELAY